MSHQTIPPARVDKINPSEAFENKVLKATDQLLNAHDTTEYSELLDELYLQFKSNNMHDKATIKDFDSRFLALKSLLGTLTNYEIIKLLQ